MENGSEIAMGLYEVGGRGARSSDQDESGGEVAGLDDVLAELRTLEALGLVRRMPDTIGEPRFAVTRSGRHAARLKPGPARSGS